jgi:hypothetical protein
MTRLPLPSCLPLLLHSSTLPFPHLTHLLVGCAPTSAIATKVDLPSPLLFLLPLLLLPIPLVASSANLTTLLVLKTVVTHDPVVVLAAWLGASNTRHFLWRGVTCYCSSAAVVAISLCGASPSDALPMTLPLPPRIRWLGLAANNFSGVVPTMFLTSPALRSLDLLFNHLSGPVVIPLANASSSPPCTTLTDICLADNLLIGGMPPGITQ